MTFAISAMSLTTGGKFGGIGNGNISYGYSVDRSLDTGGQLRQ